MIQELRQRLIDDLLSGSDGAADPVRARILDSWPGKAPAPPVLFVVPPQTQPYVIAGPTFGQHTLNLDVVILAGRSEAKDSLLQLEALIELVLVNTMDWALSGVDSPSVVTINGVDHLGSIIHLSQSGTI